MTIAEALGFIAITFGSGTALQIGNGVNEYNANFAASVDADKSCWERIAGEEGSYGGPENYSLNIFCQYKLR